MFTAAQSSGERQTERGISNFSSSATSHRLQLKETWASYMYIQRQGRGGLNYNLRFNISVSVVS